MSRVQAPVSTPQGFAPVQYTEGSFPGCAEVEIIVDLMKSLVRSNLFMYLTGNHFCTEQRDGILGDKKR